MYLRKRKRNPMVSGLRILQVTTSQAPRPRERTRQRARQPRARHHQPRRSRSPAGRASLRSVDIGSYRVVSILGAPVSALVSASYQLRASMIRVSTLGAHVSAAYQTRISMRIRASYRSVVLDMYQSTYQHVLASIRLTIPGVVPDTRIECVSSDVSNGGLIRRGDTIMIHVIRVDTVYPREKHTKSEGETSPTHLG